MDSTYQEEGRDEASGYSYLVSVTTTEVLDRNLVPQNGLLIRFKRNFFAGDHPTSRFTIALSGEISRDLRRSVGRLLSHYKLPMAAHKETTGLLSRLYGGSSRQDIQASVVVDIAYGYVPSDLHILNGLEDEVFFLLGNDLAKRNAIENKVAVREKDVEETMACFASMGC